MFACPVRKVLHQRFVVFSHAMTGREMQPLLAHERNLQGAELFRKHESSNGRSFKKHWEGFSGTPAKNAKSINIHPKPYRMEGIARNIVNHSSTQTHTGKATKGKVQDIGEVNKVMPLPLPSSDRVRG